MVSKPEPGEYAPYTLDYIALVPDDGLILNDLASQRSALDAHIQRFPERALTTPHAPGEWTIQDILGHIIDTERIYAYRALRIARTDKTDLPGFDQDDYVMWAAANTRPIAALLSEYQTVRAATLALFNSFDDAAFLRAGTANKNPLSVRAALYIIAGHELHHVASVRQNYPQ